MTQPQPNSFYTVVFDLDGTLCEQVWHGRYAEALPIPRMIKHLNSLKRRGATIVIHTARGMRTYKGDIGEIEKNLRQLTEEWLEKNGVVYDKLIFGKPAADLYIDDKALNAQDVP